MEIFQNVLTLQIETSFAYIICICWFLQKLVLVREGGGGDPSTVLIVAYIYSRRIFCVSK